MARKLEFDGAWMEWRASGEIVLSDRQVKALFSKRCGRDFPYERGAAGGARIGEPDRDPAGAALDGRQPGVRGTYRRRAEAWAGGRRIGGVPQADTSFRLWRFGRHGTRGEDAGTDHTHYRFSTSGT